MTDGLNELNIHRKKVAFQVAAHIRRENDPEVGGQGVKDQSEVTLDFW